MLGTNTMYVENSATLSETLSINAFAQNLLLNLGGSSFAVFVKILTLWLGIAWLLAVIWVIKDALQRYNNLIMPVLWFLVVLPFNLLGLLAYVILRPTEYAEEQLQDKLSLKLYKAELANYVECPACGSLNKREGDFCTECGLKLTAVCPKCEHKVWIDWGYCSYCGMQLPDDIFNLSKDISQKNVETDKNMSQEQQNKEDTDWDFFDFLSFPEIDLKIIIRWLQKIFMVLFKGIIDIKDLLVMYVISIVRGIYIVSNWITNAFLTIFKSFWDAMFTLAGWILFVVFWPFKFIYNTINNILSDDGRDNFKKPKNKNKGSKTKKAKDLKKNKSKNYRNKHRSVKKRKKNKG